MEDGLQDLLQPLQVSDYAFWINICTSHVLRLYQQDPIREAQRFHNSIPQ